MTAYLFELICIMLSITGIILILVLFAMNDFDLNETMFVIEDDEEDTNEKNTKS